MPKPHTSRSGSMQFWPRSICKRLHPRLRRKITDQKEVKVQYFAGYKVGMTHMMIVDNRKTAPTKGMSISVPATVIECPPINVLGYRLYKDTPNGRVAVTEVINNKVEKELKNRMTVAKKAQKGKDSPEYEDVTLIVYTQPKDAGFPKKTPEVFELTLSGKKEDKLKFAQEKMGKTLQVTDVVKEGNQIDIHGITKGKGYLGPVQRFGIDLRSHKSEKGGRRPGSLGGWSRQGQVMYRVAFASKHGQYQRVDYNKLLLKISDKPEEINPKGGFKHYGLVKSKYILVKGSVPGPAKRIVLFNEGARKNKKIPSEAPKIEHISLESKQG